MNNEAFDVVLQGASDSQLTAFIEEHGGDVDATIAAIAQRLAEAADTPYRLRVGWCLESLRDIYRQAIAAGDLVTARGCVKDIAKIAADNRELGQWVE